MDDVPTYTDLDAKPKYTDLDATTKPTNQHPTTPNKTLQNTPAVPQSYGTAQFNSYDENRGFHGSYQQMHSQNDFGYGGMPPSQHHQQGGYMYVGGPPAPSLESQGMPQHYMYNHNYNNYNSGYMPPNQGYSSYYSETNTQTPAKGTVVAQNPFDDVPQTPQSQNTQYPSQQHQPSQISNQLPPDLMAMHQQQQQIHNEMQMLRQQLSHYYSQQPLTPEINQRIYEIQSRMGYLKSVFSSLQSPPHSHQLNPRSPYHGTNMVGQQSRAIHSTGHQMPYPGSAHQVNSMVSPQSYQPMQGSSNAAAVNPVHIASERGISSPSQNLMSPPVCSGHSTHSANKLQTTSRQTPMLSTSQQHIPINDDNRFNVEASVTDTKSTNLHSRLPASDLISQPHSSTNLQRPIGTELKSQLRTSMPNEQFSQISKSTHAHVSFSQYDQHSNSSYIARTVENLPHQRSFQSNQTTEQIPQRAQAPSQMQTPSTIYSPRFGVPRPSMHMQSISASSPHLASLQNLSNQHPALSRTYETPLGDKNDLSNNANLGTSHSVSEKAESESTGKIPTSDYTPKESETIIVTPQSPVHNTGIPSPKVENVASSVETEIAKPVVTNTSIAEKPVSIPSASEHSSVASCVSSVISTSIEQKIDSKVPDIESESKFTSHDENTVTVSTPDVQSEKSFKSNNSDLTPAQSSAVCSPALSVTTSTSITTTQITTNVPTVNQSTPQSVTPYQMPHLYNNSPNTPYNPRSMHPGMYPRMNTPLPGEYPPQMISGPPRPGYNYAPYPPSAPWQPMPGADWHMQHPSRQLVPNQGMMAAHRMPMMIPSQQSMDEGSINADTTSTQKKKSATKRARSKKKKKEDVSDVPDSTTMLDTVSKTDTLPSENLESSVVGELKDSEESVLDSQENLKKKAKKPRQYKPRTKKTAPLEPSSPKEAVLEDENSNSSSIPTTTAADVANSPTISDETASSSPSVCSPVVSSALFQPIKPRPKAKKMHTMLSSALKKKNKKGACFGSDTEDLPLLSGEELALSELEKRRSSRNLGRDRKQYSEDANLLYMEYGIDSEGTSDAEDEGKNRSKNSNNAMTLMVASQIDEDSCVVEKILTMRIRSSNRGKLTSLGSDSEDVSQKPLQDIEEYYVKYKNLSYFHCEWATEEELLVKDKRITAKIKRFNQRRDANLINTEELDEEPFNPDFVEIDRILDESVTPDGEKIYLIKWCSLPYEDSTWEKEEDVDVDKIEKFNKFKKLPGMKKRVERPNYNEWRKINQARIYKDGNTLREYQLEGINWLLFCYYNARNCILADEMGLGKTIQSITFLEEVFSIGIEGPFLVIAPLSTIVNWQREFQNWTNMNAIVYHGSVTSRKMLQQYEMFHRNENGNVIKGQYKFHALVTTYEVVLADCLELFSEIPWRITIIDEAHRLKNKKCKLLEGLKVINTEHKVLLTGTPLQNNVDELFSLLNFLDPAQFSSAEEFLSEFGVLESQDQVSKLQQLLKPIMLRRLKEDVEKSIAPKEETIIEVELTMIQKKWYRAIIEKNFTHLAAKGASNLPSLMNTMMELRKCCNHPFLLQGVEDQILNEFNANDNSENYLKALIQSAGKIVLIDKLLPKLKEGGHRVLLFSQMVKCLDIIEEYLVHRGYSFERIDGGVRGLNRQAAIDRYSRPDSDRFIFLLCTKAGGLGINLTAADTCIIYDSDWNPQNDLQAQARCHRIGQQKHVQVYRLITRNSYEREMFDRASLKLGLDKAVLQSMSGRSSDVSSGIGRNATLSKKDVEDLLRKGAYGAVMDDDEAGKKFCEEDIDQILTRRTQVIKIETEGKGSTFSKASFAASQAGNDIALDDPRFWEKWAARANVDIKQVMKDDRIIDVPRQRKQTRRFAFNGMDEDLLGLSDFDSDDSDSKRIGKRKSKKTGSGIDDTVEFAEFSRQELYQSERGLLTYGWGNWQRTLQNCTFRKDFTEENLETLSRYILVFCLHFYSGDERVRMFLFELIVPPGMSDECIFSLRQLFGVCSSSSKRSKHVADDPAPHWAYLDYLEVVIADQPFRKHLRCQCNKIVTRIKLLYNLQHEIIGESLCDKILADEYSYASLAIEIPVLDGFPPVNWWTIDCDKCLIIGVYRHGYDNYIKIRNDPNLCFIPIVGTVEDSSTNEIFYNDGSEDPDYKPHISMKKLFKLESEIDDDTNSSPSTPAAPATPSAASSNCDTEESSQSKDETKVWPSNNDLNSRLRKLISTWQRLAKKEQLRLDKQRAKIGLLQSTGRTILARERWAKREENDFYRIISTYGLDYRQSDGKPVWDKFRILANLSKKTDENLTKYFDCFRNMCERVCGRETGPMDPNCDIVIDPITEDRARRTLQRIELMKAIRLKVLHHPKLDKRLKLCQPGLELPEWWICGKHDKDLLLGVAKHGLTRSEINILNDSQLSFHLIKDQYLKAHGKSPKMEDIEESKNDPPKESEGLVNLSKKDDQRKNESTENQKLKLRSETAASTAAATCVSPFSAAKSSQDVNNLLNDMMGIAYLVQWPKDRALIYRLEQLAQCVETGVWPAIKFPLPTDPLLNSSPHLKPGNSLYPDSALPLSETDLASEIAMQELFNLTSKRNGKQPGCSSRANFMKRSTSNDDSTMNKLRELIEKHKLSGSETESGAIDLSMKPRVNDQSERSTPDSKMDDDTESYENADLNDFNKLRYQLMEHSKPRSRRGRKRKIQPPMDPSKLDIDSISGKEHVAVVERLSGIKMSGADAPTIETIVDFLKSNPTFDIAPEWEVIVKAKIKLPPDLDTRVALPGSDFTDLIKRQRLSPKSATSSSSALPPSDLLPPGLNLGNLGVPNLSSGLNSSYLSDLTLAAAANMPFLNPSLLASLPTSLFPGTSGTDTSTSSALNLAMSYQLANMNLAASMGFNPLLPSGVNPLGLGVPSLPSFPMMPGLDPNLLSLLNPSLLQTLQTSTITTTTASKEKTTTSTSSSETRTTEKSATETTPTTSEAETLPFLPGLGAGGLGANADVLASLSLPFLLPQAMDMNYLGLLPAQDLVAAQQLSMLSGMGNLPSVSGAGLPSVPFDINKIHKDILSAQIREQTEQQLLHSTDSSTSTTSVTTATPTTAVTTKSTEESDTNSS